MKKENCCVFCEEMMSRPARHFRQKHSKEERVAKILNEEDGKRRIKLYSELIAEGNWAYNSKILSSGNSTGVIPKRKGCREESSEVSNLLPCAHCKQLYRKKQLFKHFNSCSKNANATAYRGSAQRKALELLPEKFIINEKLQRFIISRLRNDPTKEILLSDPILLEFCANILKGCFTDCSYKQLRCRIRALSRFLSCFREEIGETNVSFSDMLTNLRLHLLPTCEKYTKDFKFFNNMESLHADLLKAYEELYVNSKDEGEERIWDRSKKHFIYAWRVVRKTINFHRDNKERYREVEIPTQRQIVALYQHTCAQVEKILSTPITQYSEYRDLCKYTCVKITIQNYRRGNEVARMTIENYERRCKYDPTKFEDVQLDNFEKVMGKVTEVIRLKGKSLSHPTVAAIATPSCIKALNTVLEIRGRYIPADNNYVFARKGGVLAHFDGPDFMKDVCKEVGFNHSFLNATGFRKFCATSLCWRELSSQARNVVYQHLGHTENIHKSVYQINADISKTTVVPAILFKLLNNVDVPKDLTDYEAEQIVFQQMVGFRNEEGDDEPVPATSKDDTDDVEADLFHDEWEYPDVRTCDDHQNIGTNQRSDDLFDAGWPPSNHIKVTAVSANPSIPYSPLKSPNLTLLTSATTKKSVFTSLPSSSFTTPEPIRIEEASPRTPGSANFSLMIPCTPPSAGTSRGSKKKPSTPPPSARTRQGLKRKLEFIETPMKLETPRKPETSSTEKTPTKTKNNQNFKFTGTSPLQKSSKKSWPPEIKDILAEEFYYELVNKQPVDSLKLDRVRSKIRQRYPQFTPSSPTMRAFVTCNFPRTKTYEKHLNRAKTKLRLE